MLNTVFTLAQIGGATAANSLALMGDTGTMAIDSATYAVNIAAEYYKARLGARRSALVEVAASGVSVLALLGVTAFVFYDAIARISALDDDQEVDPIIMLAFTCVNLLVDFGMCASFLLRKTGGLAGCLPSYCPGCLGVSDRRAPTSTAPARVAIGGKGGTGMDAARGGPPRLGVHGPNTRAHSSVAGSKGSQLTRQGGGGGVSGGDGTGGSDGGGSDADGSGGDAGGGGGDGGDGDGSGGLEPAAGRCELRVPRLRSGRSLGRREPPRTPGSAPSRMRYARIGAAVDGGDDGGDATAAATASAADGLVGRRRRRRRSDAVARVGVQRLVLLMARCARTDLLQLVSLLLVRALQLVHLALVGVLAVLFGPLLPLGLVLGNLVLGRHAGLVVAVIIPLLLELRLVVELGVDLVESQADVIRILSQQRQLLLAVLLG